MVRKTARSHYPKRRFSRDPRYSAGISSECKNVGNSASLSHTSDNSFAKVLELIIVSIFISLMPLGFLISTGVIPSTHSYHIQHILAVTTLAFPKQQIQAGGIFEKTAHIHTESRRELRSSQVRAERRFHTHIARISIALRRHHFQKRRCTNMYLMPRGTDFRGTLLILLMIHSQSPDKALNPVVHGMHLDVPLLRAVVPLQADVLVLISTVGSRNPVIFLAAVSMRPIVPGDTMLL